MAYPHAYLWINLQIVLPLHKTYVSPIELYIAHMFWQSQHMRCISLARYAFILQSYKFILK